MFVRNHVPAGLLAFALVAPAGAKNIDVSTIPDRDTVQLTIYNSQDLTLVRETRRITFGRGVNPLQFSWANTLIDPTSVDLRFRTHSGELDILDTTYPHDKPQMLYWNVSSAFEGEAIVEITYFTSGITWAADYVCTADPGETSMAFDGFVKITNNSGEDYAGAQVRLVVGEINMVERVADLARRGLVSQSAADDYRASGRVLTMERAARPAAYAAMGAAIDAAAGQRKEITKEGLSEYFIFTIEGTESIPNTWSKRMRLFEGTSVPFEIAYRYRPAEYGDQLVRLYLLRNDEGSHLGSSPLPDGVVRLFRDNGRDGLSFLTAYTTKYVPIGQVIELNLGADPQVIHERVQLRSWRDAFWFRGPRVSVLFSPDQGHVIRPEFTVAGWDDHEQWVERIRNDRDEPIKVEIRRSFDGHVELASDLDPTLYDYRTPQITATIAGGTSRDLLYELTCHQGVSAKQSNVTLHGKR